jgi:hypothetical protein
MVTAERVRTCVSGEENSSVNYEKWPPLTQFNLITEQIHSTCNKYVLTLVTMMKHAI